jgi:hypothetical protein
VISYHPSKWVDLTKKVHTFIEAFSFLTTSLTKSLVSRVVPTPFLTFIALLSFEDTSQKCRSETRVNKFAVYQLHQEGMDDG